MRRFLARRATCLRLALLVLATTFSAASGCASNRVDRAPSTADLYSEVTTMFARSAAAWNRGDLDTFMRDYLPGNRTTYVTSRGVVHGPEVIREHYAARFAPGAMHDSLSFESIEIDPLAPGVINVIAQYVLMRGDSLVARGPTSLVMVRQGGQLKIVHDHSS